MSRSFGALSLTTSPSMRSAGADVLQAGDHPQRGGLPAARRADEDHELAVGDVEVHGLHGLEAVAVDLRDLVELDACHVPVLLL